MLSPSPVPTAAVYDTGTHDLSVTFDLPLAAGPLTNDELRLNGVSIGTNQRRNDGGTQPGGTTIVVPTATRPGFTAGSAVLRYMDTSHQLVGVNGAAVAPFSNFPVTVV